MHSVLFVSVPHLSFVRAGGCSASPPAGEIPADSPVCPYCIYNHQHGDGGNANEQTQDQRRGCHFSSPCHGDTQPPEPKRKLYKHCWAELRTKLDLIVGSRYFNRGIMIAILINTLSMGIEYHEQVYLCMSAPLTGCLCACVHSKWHVITV